MPDPPMPFEFDGLPMALLGARMEANLLGAPAIAPQHVLLALVHERAGLARRLLSDLSIQQARELVAPGVTIQMKAKAEHLLHTPETETAIAFARAEARRDGSMPAGPEHLLLAILRDEHVADLLRPFGITFDSVRAALDMRRLQAPVVTIADSPASDLVLARYDPVVHPEFAGMLAELPHLRGAADHAVIFTNASSEPLTSIVARWTVVDPGGTFRNKDIVHDDYSHLRHNRVQLLGLPDDSIAPGARLLVTTKGFSKALDVSRAHCGVFAGPLNYHSLENDAAEIRVSLDSAVYPDGRLVGPDIFGIGHYLQSRYKAAQEVVHRIDEAVAAGEDVDAVLRDLADKSGTPDLRWHRMFAASATTRGPERKPGYVGWLESARHMPKPPELYRDGELRSS
jgi:hypothetical protein